MTDLKRTPEPELMDDRTQAEAYAAANFAVPHQHCVDTCKSVHGPLRGAVLDLGCGPGDVLARYALANPEARFLGVDGAPVMLDIGRRVMQERGVSARVELEAHLLPSDALHTRRFDAVVSNSLLHHLADPLVLWRTVLACAVDGAKVFVMDLMRPVSADRVDALVAEHAADAEPVLRRDFHTSLHAAYRVDEVQDQLKSVGLSLQVRPVSDRHWVAYGTVE